MHVSSPALPLGRVDREPRNTQDVASPDLLTFVNTHVCNVRISKPKHVASCFVHAMKNRNQRAGSIRIVSVVVDERDLAIGDRRDFLSWADSEVNTVVFIRVPSSLDRVSL